MATSADVSLTGTDAADAGSSVALTEAEEDNAYASSDVGNDDIARSDERVVLTKESSVRGIKIATEHDDDDDDDDEGGDREDDEEYAAPMHLHALRTPARLKGAPRSRSSSRSRPGSRRNSPSPTRKVGAGGAGTSGAGGGEVIAGGILLSPSQSADSSLDGAAAVGSSPGGSSMGGDSLLDPDILLDRLGMRDLDPNATKEEIQELLRMHLSSGGLKGLPTLNERMSEETMDDVHAFQDLQPSHRKSSSSKSSSSPLGKDALVDGNASKVVENMRELLRKGNLSNSAVMGSMSYLLNTLDEECEEEGDEFSEGARRPSAVDELGEDEEENAEVAVPTSVMEELDLCDTKRRLKHQDTSMATAPSELDVSRDDGSEKNVPR